MKKIHTSNGKMKSIFLLLLSLIVYPLLGFSESLKPSEDRRKVEFFEKLYGKKIMGVKPLGEYDDPELFILKSPSRSVSQRLFMKRLKKSLAGKTMIRTFLL